MLPARGRLALWKEISAEEGKRDRLGMPTHFATTSCRFALPGLPERLTMAADIEALFPARGWLAGSALH